MTDDGSDPGRRDKQEADLEATLSRAVDAAGGELHAYPRRGVAVRRVILQEWTDGKSTQYQDAALEDDGTLRVSGRDTGPRVSEFWGSSITSYEWVYVVAPERVPALISALGGVTGADPLELLSKYCETSSGQLDSLLSSPDVNAKFSNWHS